MQDRLNINGRILSLREPPSLYAASTGAQQWCQQKLDSGGPAPSVWLLKDAVYQVLVPQTDSGRASDLHSVWKCLKKQGVKISVCQSACHRRLPEGSVDEGLFTISTLTQWADELVGQLNDVTAGIYCIITQPAAHSRFLRESIDPALSLLAMEMPVTIVFATAALDHLLDDEHWRKWRMLPEFEERVSLIVEDSELSADSRKRLLDRKYIQVLPSRDFSRQVAAGRSVYV